MNLSRLRYFITVVQEGSIGRASQKLNISQPALSKSIRLLEEEFGTKLLDRGPLGVVPTTYGQVLVRHAQTIEAELTQAHEEIRGLRGATSGHVTFAISPSVASRLLPLALDRLRESRPGISLTVFEGLANTLLSLLVHGGAEFIVGAQFEIPAIVPLRHDQLGRDRAVVGVRPEHPLVGKSDVSLQDLAHYEWVLTRRYEAHRERINGIFMNAGLSAPKVTVETDSILLMLKMVRQQNVLCFLPESCLDLEGRSADFVVIAERTCCWERRVRVSRRQRSSLSPAAKAVIRELHSAAEQLGMKAHGRDEGSTSDNF